MLLHTPPELAAIAGLSQGAEGDTLRDMAVHLVACPGCDRHVRVSEIDCPFCAAPLPPFLRARPAPPPLRAGFGRAAMMAVGISAAAASLTACGDDDADDPAGTVADIYGGPPMPEPPPAVIAPSPPVPPPPPAVLTPAPEIPAPPPSETEPADPPEERTGRRRRTLTPQRAPEPPPIDPGNVVQAYGAPPPDVLPTPPR
jgi:hypothetical protein